jgi:hypothetical protein
MPECEFRGTLFGTGNNIRVTGDLLRRTLMARLAALVGSILSPAEGNVVRIRR